MPQQSSSDSYWKSNLSLTLRIWHIMTQWRALTKGLVAIIVVVMLSASCKLNPYTCDFASGAYDVVTNTWGSIKPIFFPIDIVPSQNPDEKSRSTKDDIIVTTSPDNLPSAKSPTTKLPQKTRGKPVSLPARAIDLILPPIRVTKVEGYICLYQADPHVNPEADNLIWQAEHECRNRHATAYAQEQDRRPVEVDTPYGDPGTFIQPLEYVDTPRNKWWETPMLDTAELDVADGSTDYRGLPNAEWDVVLVDKVGDTLVNEVIDVRYELAMSRYGQCVVHQI